MVVPDTVRDTKEMFFCYMFLTFWWYVSSLLCILQCFLGLSVVRLRGTGWHASFVSSYTSDRIW